MCDGYCIAQIGGTIRRFCAHNCRVPTTRSPTPACLCTCVPVSCVPAYLSTLASLSPQQHVEEPAASPRSPQQTSPTKEYGREGPDRGDVAACAVQVELAKLFAKTLEGAPRFPAAHGAEAAEVEAILARLQVGWLVASWLAGWLAGWLTGWLIGLLLAWSVIWPAYLPCVRACAASSPCLTSVRSRACVRWRGVTLRRTTR